MAFCTAALHAAGTLVSLLEQKRVVHADLNASNILVNQPRGAVSAHGAPYDAQSGPIWYRARAPGTQDPEP